MPQQLKELVTRKFGKDISSHYDVLQLQEAIIKESGKRISSQTIKRFFGLIKSTSKSDPATLDALAGYLHFSSFKDLKKWREIASSKGTLEGNEWASEIILQILKDIKPENLHEPGLLQLIKNLFILFERHPELPSIVYPRLAASEFGRRYFFEQFIHYDALAFHYGMGLEHYLVNENVREHRAFAYSMLCMQSFLTNKAESCKYYFQKIAAYTEEEMANYHPFLIGRYYGCRVYMNAFEGLNSAAYVHEQVQLLMTTERNATDLYHGYPCAEMVFAESLIFTGHFQEAYSLLNSEKVRNYDHPPYMDRAFKTHLQIIRLMAGLFCGSIAAEKGRKEIDKLLESPIYFLCHNYIHLIIHLIKQKLRIQPVQTEKKVQEYLSILGFVLPYSFYKK